MDELLTNRQLAKIFGVSLATIDRSMRAREIEHVRLGHGRIRFRPQSLDIYLMQRTNKDIRTC
jgi:excisionase family DNA binding protein